MSISKKTRFMIFDRDKFTCRYCGRTSEDVTLEVDHVTPRSKGGTDDPSNLVTACFDCNRGKSDIALLSTPPADYLRMAQEMREQKTLAAVILEKEAEEEASRAFFEGEVYSILGHDFSYRFHKPTLRTLYSYTKEFGEAVVLMWIRKAAEITDGSDTAIGRYVSGIRRKTREENAA